MNSLQEKLREVQQDREDCLVSIERWEEKYLSLETAAEELKTKMAALEEQVKRAETIDAPSQTSPTDYKVLSHQELHTDAQQGKGVGDRPHPADAFCEATEFQEQQCCENGLPLRGDTQGKDVEGRPHPADAFREATEFQENQCRENSSPLRGDTQQGKDGVGRPHPADAFREATEFQENQCRKNSSPLKSNAKDECTSPSADDADDVPKSTGQADILGGHVVGVAHGKEDGCGGMRTQEDNSQAEGSARDGTRNNVSIDTNPHIISRQAFRH